VNDQPRLWSIVRAPQVTEKATRLSGEGQYVFRVRSDATKDEIRRAVATVFGVRVLDVNVARRRGKIKRFAGRLGRRTGSKIAYVRLAPGQQLDLGIPPTESES
jgi:large subunit ribosomal protein L23